MLLTSSPNNPLTQWVPGVITVLWWLGVVFLVVGLVLVGLGITGGRIDCEWHITEPVSPVVPSSVQNQPRWGVGRNGIVGLIVTVVVIVVVLRFLGVL
jgi:hypothetical protein